MELIVAVYGDWGIGKDGFYRDGSKVNAKVEWVRHKLLLPSGNNRQAPRDCRSGPALIYEKPDGTSGLLLKL